MKKRNLYTSQNLECMRKLHLIVPAIAQTPSAQFAATFSVKKRLMEWAEEALQGESREQ